MRIAGLIGVLLALARPPVAGAAPDLVPEVFDVALVTSDVIQGDVDEGCAGGTTGRRLLTFALRARNLGPDPLVLGDPGCPDCRVFRGAACTNPLFVCSLSHGHAHFQSFATAELRDGNGTVLAQARKYGFCLIDVECANSQFTSCNYQGISAGCSDVYGGYLPCQYIDVTDVNLPPALYSLHVVMDPENEIPEADETNNVVDVQVRLGCGTLPGGCFAIDPFLCYSTRTTVGTASFTPVNGIDLVTATESRQFDAIRRGELCTPANANGQGTLDLATQLVGYAIDPVAGSPPYLPHTGIAVTNQLEALVVDVVRPDHLLVPTASDRVVPPAPPDLSTTAVDHYECYVVRTSPRFPGAKKLKVANQFKTGAQRFVVRRPRYLCLPVDMNGDGIKSPDDALLCYGVRQPLGDVGHTPVKGVLVSNELGGGTIDTRRETELCLPSRRTLPGDLCTDPVDLAGLPASVTHSSDRASVSSDDPDVPCGTGGQQGHSLWYRFVAPQSGTMMVDTAGSSFDTVLSAYEGACPAVSALTCDDDDPTTGALTSRISFPVTAGSLYLLEVTDYGGGLTGGTVVLNASLAP